MEIRIKSCNLQASDDGKLKIGGYVNVTNRESEMMFNKDRRKYFKETMQQGVFQRALDSSNSDIPLLYEHDWGKQLASIESRNLVLEEDNIGLKFSAEIEDRSVYQQVLNKEINSCSFGFRVLEDKLEPIDDLLEKRCVSAIELMEVSLVKNPAYVGSLVETRNYEEELEERKKCSSKSEKESEDEKESDSKKEVDSKDKKDESKVKKPIEDKSDKDSKDEDKDEEERKCGDKKGDEERSVEVTITSDSDTADNQVQDNSTDSDAVVVVVNDTPTESPIDEPLTTAQVTSLVNELIQSKMAEIQQAEQQEQVDAQALSEVQSVNAQIENDYAQQCMADSLEVINLRLDLLKLNQIKDGIN